MNSLRAGSSTPSLRVDHATNHSTTSVLMPVNHSRNGVGKDGYIPTIHGAGSNGIAATTWADECRPRTLVKSNAGKQSAVTWVSFSVRASPAIFGATDGKGKRYCIGPMTVGNCERSTLPSDTSCPRKLTAAAVAPRLSDDVFHGFAPGRARRSRVA